MSDLTAKYSPIYYRRIGIFSDFKKNLKHGLTVFAIMNLIVTIGLIFKILIGGEFYYFSVFFNYGFGLVVLFFFYSSIMSDFFLIPFFVLGWLIAGLYARVRYGIYGSSALIYGVLILPGLASLTLLILSFPFILVNIPISLTIVALIGLLAVGVLILMLIYAIPAIIIAPLLIHTKKADVKIGTYVNFLVLNSPLPLEKPKACPFRSKDKPGCSYLGYAASETVALICDFESTFRACRIYGYLYYKVKGTQEEIQ